MGPRVVQQNDTFSEHPAPFFFGSTSQAYSAFHNKPFDVIVVPGAMNSVNKIPLWSQNTYLTAGGSGEDSVNVSSVITPTLHSENV